MYEVGGERPLARSSVRVMRMNNLRMAMNMVASTLKNPTQTPRLRIVARIGLQRRRRLSLHESRRREAVNSSKPPRRERLAGKTTREERSRSRKSKRQRTRRIPAESKRTRSQTLVTTLSGPAKVYTLACLLAISNPIQKMTLLGTIPRPLITAQASSDHQWHRSLERGRSRQRRVNPSAPPRSLTGPSLATLVSAIGVRKDH